MISALAAAPVAMKKTFGSFAPFFKFILLSLVILSTSRLLLMYWHSERLTTNQDWITVLIQGLRIDISSLSWLLILPVLITALCSGLKPLRKLTYWLSRLWLTLTFCFIFFMEISTPSFIMEYDLRPNRLFIEYLNYPKEVFSMLVKGHLLSLIVGLLGLCLSAYFCWLWSGKLFKAQGLHSGKSRYIGGLILVLILFLGARSTLGHRPMNPAMVYFSNDPLINSLILNSSYSVAFAAKQLAAEVNTSKLYGQLSDEIIIKNVQAFKQITTDELINQNLPTLTKQTASYRGPKKNLVIILQESLGARFVGSLGGLPLTPNLDRLTTQAWSFERMFATGTRSVRGIEAVMTGFTPTPDRAVVPRAKSQSNFFMAVKAISII